MNSRAAELAANPEAAEVGEGQDGDREANGKAYAAVADREVHGVVADGVVEEDAHDSKEGCGEKGGEAGREAHQ